jgi:competence protein ComEA
MFKKILAVLAFLLSATLAMAAVDVNKATQAELDSVKGIGPETSKTILTERKKGEFKSWDDFISRVKGVGEKRATSLSDAGLTVGGQAYKPASTAKADDKTSDKKAAESKTDAKADKAAASAKPVASASPAASAKTAASAPPAASAKTAASAKPAASAASAAKK